MTRNRVIIGSILAAAAIAVWWYGRRRGGTFTIIADVNSPHFGEVVHEGEE